MDQEFCALSCWRCLQICWKIFTEAVFWTLFAQQPHLSSFCCFESVVRFSALILPSMDPPQLPALHPIVIKHISSPPFEYSEKGLTFKGHPRESIADLKQWIFPKGKNDEPPNRVKDWWLAQLRLHGLNVKASSRKGDVMEALKSALSSGLDGPPNDLVRLEQELERKFLLENEEARLKEYPTLSVAERALKYSERYLREKFFNGVNDARLLALKIGSPLLSRDEDLHRAAAKLGLHSQSAYGPRRRMWIIVGKKERHVLKRKSAIEEEYYDWETRKSDAKQRKLERCRRELERRRQKLQAGGEGSFKDVEGQWSIECPAMDQEYGPEIKDPDRRMSIFFHVDDAPEDDEGNSSYYHSEDDGDGSSRDHSEDGSSRDHSEDDDEGEEVYPTPILCANFEMGMFDGMLRSDGDLAAPTTCFPVMVPFNWRGIETIGERVIHYSNHGSLNFISKTQVEGVFHGWSFTGIKVGKTPDNTSLNRWECYSQEAYERARVNRWR